MIQGINDCHPHRRLARRGVSLFFALLLLLWLPATRPTAKPSLSPPEGTGSSGAGQGSQDVRPLEPGQPIERELTSDENHFYQLTLGAGQSVQVTVEQFSINLRLRLLGPDGKLLIEASSWWEGLQRLWWVAEASGAYRLEIFSASKQNTPGRYRVRSEELRQAGPPERRRVAAQQAFYEARELGARDEAQSRLSALPKFQEALQLWRAFGDQREEARVLLEIVITYSELSEYQQALAYGEQALQLRPVAADRNWEATLLNTLGEAYQYLGEYEQARANYEQALPLWRALGYRPGEAWTLNNLGVICNAVGERQQALDYYQQSLSAYQAAGEGHTYGQALELTRLGAFYASLGEPEKAREALQQAWQFWQSYPDPRQARTLHYLGDVYATGSERTALEYYSQALQRWRTIGDRYWESTTLHSMGQTAASAGETERALDYFKQALALRREIGDRRGQAVTLTHLGALHYSLGATPQALDHFHEALTLGREIGDREGTAERLYHLARVARERGAWDEARAQVAEALRLVEQVRANFISQELRASYLATVRDYYEFYIDLLMQSRERHPPEDLPEGFAAQALQASERARARSLLELLAEAGADIRQGADQQLVARERAVEQRLNAKAAQRVRLLGGQPAPAQIAALDREIAALDEESQQLEAQLRAASPRYAALTQPQPLKLAEIQQLLADDTLLLEYALGPQRSYLWAVTPARLDSFELPNRAEIEAAAQRVYQLLTARNQRPPGETAARRRVRVAQADAEYRTAAAALSHMLLGPVAAQLGNKRLLIVAQGRLQFIPFAALPVPEMGRRGDGATGGQKSSRPRTGQRDLIGRRIGTEGQKASRPVAPMRLSSGESPRRPVAATPLIVNHEVVNLPSASVLAVLRRETAARPPAPKTLAVLADPVFSADDERVRARTDGGKPHEKPATAPPLNRDRLRDVDRALEDVSGISGPAHLARLSGTGWEAEQILARVPAGQQLKALDFAASRATATDPSLSQYRLVHFATHALIDNLHPELSGIVLSLVDEQGREQDGFLRAHEIFNLKLNAELVVLSACQTGLGKEVKGEGIIGLTRSFMYAGAPRVVVSLWSVRDKEAAELMVRFYKRLLGPERLSPAAALRAAQVEMWRDQRWRSPYYWAAFTLQGEWK